MARAVLAVVLVWSGCGRYGFTGDAAIDGALDAAAPAGPASCVGLANVCGPMNESCCASPLVSAGTFLLANDAAADAMYTDTAHSASVQTFRLDKYEVTVGRFRNFVEAGMGTQQHPPAADAGARVLNNGMADQGGWDSSWNPILWPDTAALVSGLTCDVTFATYTASRGANEDRPINCITWYDAMAFCVWDGGFLPTEAEWNYAASDGAAQRAYPWSNPASSTTIDCTLADYNNGPCVPEGTNNVGSVSPAGDGAFGQADLGGNVWEWTLDYFNAMYSTPCIDCASLFATASRAKRGGAYDNANTYLRAAARQPEDPAGRFPQNGVRCARAP